jgi:hypothetical protein
MDQILRRAQAFVAAKSATLSRMQFLLFEVVLTTMDTFTDSFTAYELYKYVFVVLIFTQLLVGTVVRALP